MAQALCGRVGRARRTLIEQADAVCGRGTQHLLDTGDLSWVTLPLHPGYVLLFKQRRDNSPFDIFDQPLWLMRGTDRTGKNDFARGQELWRKRYADGLEERAAR